MNTSTQFFTKDLYFGAYLYLQGVKLIEVRKNDYNLFLWFIFEDTTRCKKLENKFWGKEAIIELTSYLYALKTLKQRVFQEYPKGG